MKHKTQFDLNLNLKLFTSSIEKYMKKS